MKFSLLCKHSEGTEGVHFCAACAGDVFWAALTIVCIAAIAASPKK